MLRDVPAQYGKKLVSRRKLNKWNCTNPRVNPYDADMSRLMPNTHRRHRHDSTVELSRVGGVY